MAMSMILIELHHLLVVKKIVIESKCNLLMIAALPLNLGQHEVR